MMDRIIDKPVFLIGYRATGKSSTGKMLAEALELPFYDMDAVIQERAGKTVREIVDSQGWEEFRGLERQLLEELTALEKPAVIACGGGAVLHQDLFRKAGRGIKVVWLMADVETVTRRLKTDPATGELRPALQRDLALEDEIRTILEERISLYKEFSNYQVDTGENSVQDTVKAIKKWIEGEN